MEIAAEVSSVLDAESKLGEGVLWDAQRGVVWFVDIKRHYLWHYDPATGSNAKAEAPEQIGWALPADNGLLLCGLKDGLYTFDSASQAFTKLMTVPGEPAGNRLNDACTDPWGRVWFGPRARAGLRSPTAPP
jgi:D-xylonolactonase